MFWLKYFVRILANYILVNVSLKMLIEEFKNVVYSKVNYGIWGKVKQTKYVIPIPAQGSVWKGLLPKFLKFLYWIHAIRYIFLGKI